MRTWRTGLLITLLAAVTSAPGQQSGDPQPSLRAEIERAVDSADSFRNRFDAQVWLGDMSSRLAAQMPNLRRRLRFLRMLHYEATRAGLEPEWVLAVIQVESAFNRFAVSSAAALGYMQVMPFWLDEIGRPADNLFDTQTNLRMGCTILSHYLKREDGNLTRALARYNGSVGQRWYPNRVYKALKQRWHAQ